MYMFAKQLTGRGRGGVPAVKSIHNLHHKSFKITTYVTKKNHIQLISLDAILIHGFTF